MILRGHLLFATMHNQKNNKYGFAHGSRLIELTKKINMAIQEGYAVAHNILAE